MKINVSTISLLSVALFGLFAGLPAQANDTAATEFSNPTLAQVIRAQGDQASAAINADVKANLLLQARTLDMPGVTLGPTRLVKVNDSAWLDKAQTKATALEVDMELWLNAMLSNSERDLYHALSLARFIIITAPQPATAR
ncbi:MAG TPA: hypothetical protein VFP95_02765 [Gammaproteobacteria bacterium]|nr:hypothetical protein [Gammaproteobacteria bacterium]